MNARRTLIAFFGFAFVTYWLSTADLSSPKKSLGPIVPSLIRLPAEPESPPPQVEAQPPSRKPAQLSELETWMRQESERLGKPDETPDQTLARLRKKAAGLGANALNELRRYALDPERTTDQRFLAVYMLGLAGARESVEHLKVIAGSQIPDAGTDRERTDEVILRAHAVDALVEKMSPRNSREFLMELLSRTSDPAIARHAQYWLSRSS